jgi:hypothetical protein
MTKSKSKPAPERTLLPTLDLLGEQARMLSAGFQPYVRKKYDEKRDALPHHLQTGDVGKYADLCNRFATVARTAAPVLPAGTRAQLARQNKTLGNLALAINETQKGTLKNHSQLLRVVDAQVETVNTLNSLKDRRAVRAR